MTKESDVHIEAKLAEITALTRLNSRQRERIRSLLGNPGGQEFELFKDFIGLTPAQARLLIAEEYFRRFKPDRIDPVLFNLEMVLESLPSSRSWLGLDSNIKTFLKTREKHFSWLAASQARAVSGQISMDFPEKLNERLTQGIDFWDKMRYLLEALPQQREFKDKHATNLQQPKRGWSFETCDLCWRTLPVNPELRKKTGRLCFEHDLPATDSVYRRHKRLKAQVDSAYREVLQRLKPQYPPSLSNEAIAGRLQIELTSPESVLPNLVKHLQAVGHDGRPESLLLAFHGPFPKGLKAAYQEAMGTFFQDALKYPYVFTLDELTLAEVWLTALQPDRRRKIGKTSVASSVANKI